MRSLSIGSAVIASSAALVLSLPAASAPLTSSAPRQWFTVTSRTRIASTPEPFECAAGDFDRDGRPDLVATFEGSDEPQVLLGNGDGTLTPKPWSGDAVGAPLRGVVVADFDRDGRLDFAVARAFGEVALLLGRGDGTFAEFGWVKTGVESYDVAAGDFDGDGRIDLVVSDPYAAEPGAAGSITVAKGDGTGKFPTKSYSQVGTEPRGLALGDFDRDGHLDVAVACADGAWLALGKGDGSLGEAARLFAALGTLRHVVAGDLDGDQILDLAVGADKYPVGSDAWLGTSRGRGDGTFDPGVGSWVRAGVRGMALADFDQDGRAELAVAGGLSSAPQVEMLSVSGASLSRAYVATLPGIPAGPCTADFNGDGWLDIAAPSSVRGTDGDADIAVVAGGARPELCILGLGPNVGTVGTLVWVDLERGDTSMRLNVKLRVLGGRRPLALKAARFPGQSVSTVAGRVTQARPAGTYHLCVVPRGGKPIVEDGAFTFLAPKITSVVPASGGAGTEVVVTCDAIGTARGSVYLQLPGAPKRIKCTVTAWPRNPVYADGGSARFRVPRKLVAGRAYDVVVVNKVGEGRAAGAFTAAP